MVANSRKINRQQKTANEDFEIFNDSQFVLEMIHVNVVLLCHYY